MGTAIQRMLLGVALSAATTIASFWPVTAMAQGHLTFSATSAESIASYWSATRLANARARAVPRPSSAATTQRLTAQVPSVGVGADGSPGLINAVPDPRNGLFVPSLSPIAADNEGVAPLMFGTSNAPFTSSRMVPAVTAAIPAERVFPHRINGKLFFTDGVSNFVCSATVLRRGVVLTAGHCVHQGSGGSAGFFRNFLFIPALRDGVAPFNSWPGTFVVVTNTWATGGGVVPNAADYAMIEVANRTCSGAIRFIGDCIGFAGFQTGSFANEHITSVGYPCNIDSCQKMHRVDAEPHRAFSPNNLTIGSDMRGGSSGGAWLQNYGQYGVGQPGTGSNAGINRIRAVTSFGFDSTEEKETGASIFDSRFTQILNKVCVHRAGNC